MTLCNNPVHSHAAIVHVLAECPLCSAAEQCQHLLKNAAAEESTLSGCCVALGWQGGTRRQVIDEIVRLRAVAGDVKMEAVKNG